MQGFFNYVNRQLCEYHSIFPTAARLLDHLLFVNGTGLDVSVKHRMIMDGRKRIDQYPEMTDDKWQKLIADCHAKERKFALQYARDGQKATFARTTRASSAFSVSINLMRSSLAPSQPEM